MCFRFCHFTSLFRRRVRSFVWWLPLPSFIIILGRYIVHSLCVNRFYSPSSVGSSDTLGVPSSAFLSGSSSSGPSGLHISAYASTLFERCLFSFHLSPWPMCACVRHRFGGGSAQNRFCFHFVIQHRHIFFFSDAIVWSCRLHGVSVMFCICDMVVSGFFQCTLQLVSIKSCDSFHFVRFWWSGNHEWKKRCAKKQLEYCLRWNLVDLHVSE